jgi:hypothetical protein
MSTIQFPNWTIDRLLSEAITAWNVRHHGYPLDVRTSPWKRLYVALLTFCRHSLSDYDAQLSALERDLVAQRGPDLAARHLEARNALRQEIHGAARRHYPWLKPDSDPRKEMPEAKPKDPRLLNQVSAEVATLVSHRAELIAVTKELRRKNATPDWRERVAALDAQLADIEDKIQVYSNQFKTLEEITGDPTQANWRMLNWVHPTRGYFFGGRPLPPNLISPTKVKCAACGKTVWRSNRELDFGAGIRLVALSCECSSVATSREFSYPNQEGWSKVCWREEEEEAQL